MTEFDPYPTDTFKMLRIKCRINGEDEITKDTFVREFTGWDIHTRFVSLEEIDRDYPTLIIVFGQYRLLTIAI